MKNNNTKVLSYRSKESNHINFKDNSLLSHHFSKISHDEIPIIADFAEEQARIESSMFKQVFRINAICKLIRL